MRKIIFALMISVFLLVPVILTMSSLVFAAPERKGAPEFVPQLSEDKLTKIVFITYAPGKEPTCDNDGTCESGENWKNCPNDCQKGEETLSSGCYKFLSGSRPKWYSPEDYYYSTGDLGTVSEWATLRWDKQTSATIFGSGISGSYSWGVYDYKNAIVFGNYKDPNVIAVTALWYKGKYMYEYDIMFDRDYFPSSGFGTYDLKTVALHEFGHAAGLGDLYNSVCSEEVMYGYYTGTNLYLGSGDIAGIRTLYGA
jgi:hypothetical protein